MNEKSDTTVDQTPVNSAKREIAATVISTAVAVTLGIVANVYVNKFATRVRDQIAPKTETE